MKQKYHDIYAKIALLSISVILSYALSLLPLSKDIENRGYDILCAINSKHLKNSDIVIVGIDEISFDQLKHAWPWPRSLHANLLNALNNAGAKSIIFDVIFSELTNKKEDTALSNAIQKHSNIILSSDSYTLQTQHVAQQVEIKPHQLFLDAGAHYANAQLPLDRDGVIRRAPLSTQSIWAKTLHVNKAEISELKRKSLYYINYSAPLSFAYASFYQALNPNTFLPKDFFKDKIVLIGLYSNVAFSNQGQPDSFLTPLFNTTNMTTSGVIIHANIISNYLNHNFITPLSKSSMLIIMTLVALLLLNTFWNRALYLSTLLSTTFIIVTIIGAIILYTQGVWLKYIMVINTIIILYLLHILYTYFKTRKERNHIRHAFKSYLSPKMVDLIISNPKLPNLSGERKLLTILFCDLANFTTVCEDIHPVKLSEIINTYFSRMTHILHQYDATVDKYIGDAVMAFWGAPLPDENQTDHAITAAIAMLHSFEDICTTYSILKDYDVTLRIGINTGEAIIGNFGSHERLSYTAIGDTVNTASRLESNNKIYKTKLLISHNTYTLLSIEKKRLFKEIGEIPLKGKTNTVCVYTLKEVF